MLAVEDSYVDIEPQVNKIHFTPSGGFEAQVLGKYWEGFRALSSVPDHQLREVLLLLLESYVTGHH